MLARMADRALSRDAAEAALGEARLAMLDTAACILAGTETEAAQAVAAMQSASGAGGIGARALYLGAAAHALDFDDYEKLGSTHSSAAVVPALIALSETRPVTHEAVLRAWIAGYETILSVGKALGYGHYLAGWHSSGTLGGIGAAAAGAHLLGLDRARFTVALSLAMTQAAGMKAQFGSGAKPLHCGLAARAGVESVLLAEAGLTAKDAAAEGEIGFLAMFGTADAPGWDRSWPDVEEYPPYRKPWPSCAYTHRIVEAAERIGARVDADQIASGVIRTPEPYLAVAGFAQPESADEARFSMAFCAESMLLDGYLKPSSFEPDARSRPALRQLLETLACEPYPLPEGAGDVSPLAPDTLTVTLADGSVIGETVADLHGGPSAPLGADAVVEKYVACRGSLANAQAYLDAPPSGAFRSPSTGSRINRAA